MLEKLIMELAEYGVIAIILGVVLYDNFKMKAKLFDVIENNTKALTELVLAQKQRRKEFEGQ